MDCQVIWSPAALDDVDDIAAYIARDSAHYASAVVSKILAITRSIPEFPHLGRQVPEIGDVMIRERIVYSYRIIYQIAGSVITIVAVIHGRRLLDPVLDRINPS
jgi:plasmid stabilization system protein ParE